MYEISSEVVGLISVFSHQQASPLGSAGHNQQFVSWVYLYLITAAAENTLISMGNTFPTCVFFNSKTNRTSVQTDCIILVFSIYNTCFCFNF